MKKLALYHIGAVLILISQTALAVTFDIKKGFVYDAEEIQQQKQVELEKKLSKPFVKVLRLFNEDNKISDPLLSLDPDLGKEIQFLTINDRTANKDLAHQEAAREVASLNGNLDWSSIEKNLLELESQFGIRSMPVVQFSKIENLDTKSFAHRVEYLENKLGIQPENKQIAALPQRLIVIKQKLNVETETLGLDLNL
jgi:hypothetical protein